MSGNGPRRAPGRNPAAQDAGARDDRKQRARFRSAPTVPSALETCAIAIDARAPNGLLQPAVESVGERLLAKCCPIATSWVETPQSPFSMARD